ncbi:MAG: DUF2179 domain-containing protein [Planctomycetes bacterium]|jgi:uncharacterized protein YebE (UPF0316 family)|nr:DUF2179 domain-containing protein [Planctomycetota bacterium]
MLAAVDLVSSHSPLFTWVILPILIFLSRIADVSIGTVRVILVSRRLKYLAPVAGFFEVLIWILVIGQIMKNLSSPVCYVAYAGGFAAGNFVGILIAERLSIGTVLIRVIFPKQVNGLIARLREKRYGVTCIDGQGANGPVQIVFTIVPRREAYAVIALIQESYPEAFYSIEDVDFVERGVFPVRRRWGAGAVADLVKSFRPGKSGN